jgi:hypothetical protein
MKHELHREQRAVMYLRVAHAGDDSDRAITAQRSACEQIANAHGVTVVREYVDLGKPARWEQQTELQRLLTDLAEHRDVGYIVIFDYARLARDLASLDGIIRRIHLCGAEIATTTGVAAVERFRPGNLLDRVSEWAQRPEPVPPYPLALLRAAHRGLGPDQSLLVTALLPNGDTVHGAIIGIGLRLGISTVEGRLVEDVRAEWVAAADVQQWRRS